MCKPICSSQEYEVLRCIVLQPLYRSHSQDVMSSVRKSGRLSSVCAQVAGTLRFEKFAEGVLTTVYG